MVHRHMSALGGWFGRLWAGVLLHQLEAAENAQMMKYKSPQSTTCAMDDTTFGPPTDINASETCMIHQVAQSG